MSDEVLVYALSHRSKSTFDIRRLCSLTRGRVRQILQAESAYPYHVTLQQPLLPHENERQSD